MSARFPYSRDNYTLDGLLNLSLSRWKENWLPLGLCTLGLLVVSVACAWMLQALRVQRPVGSFDQGSFNPDISVIAMMAVQQIVSTMVQTALYLMLFGYVLDILEGKPTGVARSLARLRALPTQLLAFALLYGGAFVVVGLIAGIIMITHAFTLLSMQAWLVLGVFVGGGLLTWLFVSFAFVMYELAYDPTTSMISAMQTSLRLVHGQRLRVLCMSIVMLLISFAGVLLCCVGFLASMPLGSLFYGAMFLALKRPSRGALAMSPQWPV